jgi:hypothetical protein
MAGRQDGTSQTHAADRLHQAVAEAEAARSARQATEMQTAQIAQIAQAVAVAMDKIAATSQEMAEQAAQLRNLSTWSWRQHRNPASRLIQTLSPARLRATNGTHKIRARALRPGDDRLPPASSREITAVIQTAAVIPLRPGRALPAGHQDLAEVTPAIPGTHREQELDLLDWTISNLFHIGLILLPAARQHGEATQGTAEALQCLDDTICRIRDHVRDAHANGR